MAFFSSAISSALIDSVIRRVSRSHVHHARIGAIAGGEAVGPLLGAIAREIGAAHEAVNALADRDVEAGLLDAGHRARDRAAHLKVERGSEGVLGELLDAEPDPLAFDAHL